MPLKRIIFHIDVNNAFLSWTAVHLLKKGEKLDIRKIPSIIGGDEKSRHGIVLAKSPVAKKLGIKTADTIYSARKKCANLKIYPPEFDWYQKMSNKMYTYLCDYTPNIERFSIDECFLDFTGTSFLYNDYLELAYHIKEDIKNKFGFTVNVGIGNNKLCAKMASDFEKPDKVHTLYQEEIEKKMWPLPIEDLFMVGKKTSEVLRGINIRTIGDLAHAPNQLLERYFKNQAIFLKRSALGIDDSKVAPRIPKKESISISETLPFDYQDRTKLKEVLFRQVEDVTRQLRREKKYTSTVAIIYKNNRFQKYSAQSKLKNATDNTKEIYKLAVDIFEKSYKEDPIRLIGVRLADLTTKGEQQLSLFEKDISNDKESEIQSIVDEINEKFGKSLIIPASIKAIGQSRRKDKSK